MVLMWQQEATTIDQLSRQALTEAIASTTELLNGSPTANLIGMQPLLLRPSRWQLDIRAALHLTAVGARAGTATEAAVAAVAAAAVARAGIRTVAASRMVVHV
jgi:hypothetical protein